MDTMPRVSIIILNWNGWKDTIECLESVYQITYPNYDVIVVDNGSEDESIEKIKAYAEGKIRTNSKFFEYSEINKPIQVIEYQLNEIESNDEEEIGTDRIPPQERLILIKSDKNYGFAEGNNIAIRYSLRALKPQYVLLLNNDTVVDQQFLFELIFSSLNEENCGICGSKLHFYDHPEIIQSAGCKINWLLGNVVQIDYRKKDQNNYSVSDVDTVSGCSMLINRSLIDKIGLLNTELFAYYEDTDYCIRAQNNGYRVIFVPNSKVWHKVSGTSRKTSGLREYYSMRNLVWFVKTYSKSYYPFLLYLLFFKIWFNCAVITLYHRNPSALRGYFYGVYDGLFSH
jgi:GT2 family glycosyltransferase